MRYLTILLSLLFVLSFAGCKKDKDASMEMKDTATEAVEEATETTMPDTTIEVMEGAEEIVE